MTTALFWLAVVLAVLRLAGVLPCSWWLVTAPLWLGALAVAVLLWFAEGKGAP